MQNSKILFKGIMPALLTPLDENEKLIRPSVKKLMDYEYKGGVHGFYVGGATGEGPVLPAKTRMDLCEAAMEANEGRGKIILHVGGPNFTDVKELVRHATAAGVDGISAMAPNAYFAHTDRELIDYYKRIASMTDKPLMVYVTPLMLGNNLEPVFEELLAVDNIIGLKFTLSDYYRMSLLKMINGGNVNVINGPDEMLLSGLAMGADGGIGSTYNLMAPWYINLYNKFISGDMDGARAQQYAINKVIRVLITFGGGVAAIKNLKVAMQLKGVEMGITAFPAAVYTDEERAELKRLLIEAGADMSPIA